MEFTTEKDWIAVKDEIEDYGFIKKKLIPFAIVFFVAVITIMIISFYIAHLLDTSGLTITDFEIGEVWLILLLIASLVIPILIVMSVFKGCYNKVKGFVFSIFASFSAVLILHGLAHGMWFALQVSGTSGDLHTILVLTTVENFLVAVIGGLALIWEVTMADNEKNKCDTVLNGTNLSPQFYNGEDINAKIRCKKNGKTVMCEIPRISKIE